MIHEVNYGRRMASFGMLRHVTPVRTDVSEDLSASIIMVTRISDLGTLAVISNRRTLRRGFHGGDYEECRLLEYKTPVRTSQVIHYCSVTEPTRLILCKI
jgi:hypothetical protein